jgi:hypothetical protein
VVRPYGIFLPLECRRLRAVLALLRRRFPTSSPPFRASIRFKALFRYFHQLLLLFFLSSAPSPATAPPPGRAWSRDPTPACVDPISCSAGKETPALALVPTRSSLCWEPSNPFPSSPINLFFFFRGLVLCQFIYFAKNLLVGFR